MVSRIFLLCLALTAVGCSNIIDATQEQPIQDDPSSRTTGSFIDDELIEVKSLVNIGKASEQLQKSHISVTSYNGVVLLTGQIPDQGSRQLAENIVKDVRKVRLVHNELQISGPTSHIIRTNDTWITAKIKGQMLAEKNFNPIKVKVVTENGVVYLFGLVSRKDAEKSVNIVKRSHGVQQIVKLFEYTD